MIDVVTKRNTANTSDQECIALIALVDLPFISDLEKALTIVKPSNLNEYSSKIPDIKFRDLYGTDDIIQEIKTSVTQPFHHPEKYIELGISLPIEILIHGPTGVEKTMHCSALASEADVNFMLAESSKILSKVVGTSLASENTSDKIVTGFLTEMDRLLTKSRSKGAHIDLVVVAAANRIKTIDAAVLRTGHFDVHNHIPLLYDKPAPECQLI
ncbi:hypothetical protein [Parasitella parasitica]|uniref:ATPase AAA-type core domain-containing protein n=1 Tax=Parasitella parasitica TaxID=35722 RepID=A0A0B7N7T9_9FUNG|nr:hypothetical protein [Parasitella parasitica]